MKIKAKKVQGKKCVKVCERECRNVVENIKTRIRFCAKINRVGKPLAISITKKREHKNCQHGEQKGNHHSSFIDIKRH